MVLLPKGRRLFNTSLKLGRVGSFLYESWLRYFSSNQHNSCSVAMTFVEAAGASVDWVHYPWLEAEVKEALALAQDFIFQLNLDEVSQRPPLSLPLSLPRLTTKTQNPKSQRLTEFDSIPFDSTRFNSIRLDSARFDAISFLSFPPLLFFLGFFSRSWCRTCRRTVRAGS